MPYPQSLIQVTEKEYLSASALWPKADGTFPRDGLKLQMICSQQ